jgi:hypothetical protein
MSWSNAALVTADLAGRLDIARQMDFSVGGVDFYATASSGNSASWVNQSAFGLGVSSYLLEVNTQIDGTGRDDVLWLTFQKPVTLVSATFSGVGLRDDFVLLGSNFKELWSDRIRGSNPYDFTKELSLTQLTGTFFAFTVKDTHDDYFLRKITFETQTVPVPAPAVLLFSGLVGLVLIRRRRAG